MLLVARYSGLAWSNMSAFTVFFMSRRVLLELRGIVPSATSSSALSSIPFTISITVSSPSGLSTTSAHFTSMPGAPSIVVFLSQNFSSSPSVFSTIIDQYRVLSRCAKRYWKSLTRRTHSRFSTAVLICAAHTSMYRGLRNTVPK